MVKLRADEFREHSDIACYIIIIITIITEIELSLGGSNLYAGTDKTKKNKYI